MWSHYSQLPHRIQSEVSACRHKQLFAIKKLLFYRVHAVCVCDTADYFYNHIDEHLEVYGLTKDSEGKPLKAREMVDIVEGYKGLGYGKSTDEELGW